MIRLIAGMGVFGTLAPLLLAGCSTAPDSQLARYREAEEIARVHGSHLQVQAGTGRRGLKVTLPLPG